MAVIVLTGPVGAGKTAFLAERYREAAARSLGAAAWLAPTEPARLAIASRLAADGLLAPNILTFPEFAKRIALADRPAAWPLPELHQRLILRHVLAESRRDWADARGLGDAAFALISELRGQGVTPELFDRASREIGAEPGVGEFGRVFASYQKFLERHDWFDRGSIYARAAARWSAGRREPFTALSCLVLDGFVNLTPPQEAILTAVSQSGVLVWVSLPADADDARAELFAQPSRTVTRLKALPTTVTVSQVPPRDGDRPAGLRHLRDQLFRPLRQTTRAADAAGLHLIEAPGRIGELRLVARAVKRLCLDGVAADSILIAARDLHPYADRLRDVFAEYGIPVALDGVEPLDRNPAVATLLRWLRVPDDGWPFDAVAAVLRSTYFRPDWAEFTSDTEVSLRSEMLLRTLGEPRGRDHLSRAVELWAAEQQPGLEDEHPEEPKRLRRHETAVACAPFLRRFFACWDRMPARATVARFADRLGEFTRDTGMSLAANADDAAALDQLDHELRSWSARERQWHDRPPTYPRGELLRLTTALAASSVRPRGQTGPGRVRVLPAELARAVPVDYLFLIGLGERGFPAPAPPHPLLTDDERQRFAGVGLDLAVAGDRLTDEMMLFYQLITRARKRLTLSYPATDGAGQPLQPGTFLTAVLDCFQEIPRTRRRMLLDGYADPPMSPAEYRVSWATRGGPPPGPVAEHLQRAKAVAADRFDCQQFGRYDGLLGDVRLRAAVAGRFGPDKVISPTALERYVECPFRFFLEQVLRLEPLPGPVEEVEPTRRGAAFHRALARLHRNARDADELTAELDAAVDEYARRSSSPAAKALWALEARRMRRAAARYAKHWHKLREPWQKLKLDLRPAHLETDFGVRPAPGAAELPPLVFGDGELAVKVGGRIDRVDVIDLPDGTRGYFIIDYKTGRSVNYPAAKVRTLERLQLSLYALAAELVLAGDAKARLLGVGYWLVTDTGPLVALPGGKDVTAWCHKPEGWHAHREQLRTWVGELVRRVRSAEFPLRPRSDDCTATCSFGAVCRISQSRSVCKSWQLPLPAEGADGRPVTD